MPNLLKSQYKTIDQTVDSHSAGTISQSSEILNDTCEIFSTYIKSAADEKYIISVKDRPVQAKLSRSCFLKPNEGDCVLVSSSQRGEVYVLSVLHQKNAEESVVNIHAGAVLVNANDVHLEAKKDLSLKADQGKFVIKTCHWVSHLWNGFFEKFIRHTGYAQKTSTISHEAANSYMLNVSGHIQQQANSVDIKADKCFQVHSETAIIQADENLVIPTKQTSFM